MIKHLIFISICVFLAFFFYSYISPTPPAWTGPLLTFAGIVIAAFMVVYQLQNQHVSNLEIQKENKRDEFRLKIFEELSQKVSEAGHALIEDRGYLSFYPITLRSYNDQTLAGITPTYPELRFHEHQKLHEHTSDATISLMGLLEKYEIVFPEAMKLFRLALSSSLHDVDNAYRKMHLTLIKRLPMDVRGGIHFTPATEEEITELEELIKHYSKSISGVENYIYDMVYEFQNVFLKELFNNKVTKREPLDPKYRVLSTDPEEMKILEHYFNNDTEYGNDHIETKKRVLDKLKEESKQNAQ